MYARRWPIAATVCVVIFLALAAFKYFQIQAAIAYGKSFPESSATVESMVAKRVDTEFFTTTIGEVIAPEFIELRNELGGRITRINMQSGGEVIKGELLIQFDIAEEQAQLQAAQASSKLASLNLKREQDLIKKRLTSQESADQARAQFDIAQASVRRWQAQIEKKTITAPFDAHIGIHTLEVGQYLNANTSLAELVGKNSYSWIDFSLPASETTIGAGTNVLVTLPGGENDETSNKNHELEARVIASDVTLSAQSRNRRYRAQIDAHPSLLPNTIVNVKVSLGKKSKIQVPKLAVLQDPMGAYVFSLTPDTEAGGFRAERRSINIGRETEDTVIVENGLLAGTLIATDGAFKLQEGLLVFTDTKHGDPTAQADINNNIRSGMNSTNGASE